MGSASAGPGAGPGAGPSSVCSVQGFVCSVQFAACHRLMFSCLNQISKVKKNSSTIIFLPIAVMFFYYGLRLCVLKYI